MLDLISIVLIFILDNVPLAIPKGMLVMPYLSYIVYMKKSSFLFFFIILLGIFSLQSSSFMKMLLFFVLTAIFYYLFFSIFDYSPLYIIVLSFIQILAWEKILENNFSIKKIVISLFFYYFMNYIYMRRANK